MSDLLPEEYNKTLQSVLDERKSKFPISGFSYKMTGNFMILVPTGWKFQCTYSVLLNSSGEEAERILIISRLYIFSKARSFIAFHLQKTRVQNDLPLDNVYYGIIDLNLKAAN